MVAIAFECFCLTTFASDKAPPPFQQQDYIPAPVPALDTAICTIPFRRLGNLIIVEAEVNGVKGNFILDTGAPRLVLNLTYFRNAAARPQTTAGGISGGLKQALHIDISRFTLGNYKYKKIDADVAPLGHIEDHIKVKISGLIGVNMLRNFTMLIDYPNSQLKIKMLKRKENFSFKNLATTEIRNLHTLPIRIYYDKILLSGNLSGKKLNLIIDTGAESNVIDSRLPDALLEKINVTGRILLSGASSKKVEAFNGDLEGLSISGISIKNLPVIVTNLKDMCYAFDFCIDGMLGFDFLSPYTVEINFAKSELNLWN